MTDTLAIFDLDDTLLAADSGSLWGEFLVAQGVLEAEAFQHANDHFERQYRAGMLDVVAFLEFSLAPLVPLSPDRLQRLRTHFLEAHIPDVIAPGAPALLNSHRQQGDLLMVITATHRLLTQPIVEHLGIDLLLASEPVLLDGHPTGAIQGTPCYREGKVERLREWLDEDGFKPRRTWFYSDSLNDLPLLEQVTDPVAVDPDPILAREARCRGWPIISLRHDY